MRKKSAYTTLELLIVLTIIGFFVAMVGPKLVGMFSDSQEKISRANISDLSRVIGEWQLNHPGLLPNDMTNVVYHEGAASYYFPSLAEELGDEDGAEWICWDMANRLKFYRHYLNAAEVSELNSMGITHVRMLDSYTPNKRVELAADVAVLMIGAGRAVGAGGVDGAWQCAADTDNYAATWRGGFTGTTTQPDPAEISRGVAATPPADYEPGIAYPDMLFRIVMAVGPDCQLVSDGTLDASPHSPDAMSRSKYYRLDQYLVVLPRLQATVSSANTDTTANSPKTVTAQRIVDGVVTDEKTFIVCDTIGEAVQSPEQFDVLSPEGFNLNDPEEDLWSVTGVTTALYP